MKFSVQRQISVAIENQPGRLAATARALSERGINIKDLTILDTVEQGVIRMVTSNPEGCRALLQEQGFHPVEADVLVIDLPDIAGKLADVSQALADAGINIDYAYGSEGPSERRMRLVLKVSPLARACEVLKTFQGT